eukprot:Polyplicarium_translucidae@DN2486_c0_g1_i3.p1
MDGALKGQSFSHVFGATRSMLELLLVKRRIRGPQWLRVQNFAEVPDEDRKSWCKRELTIKSHKDVSVWGSGAPQAPNLSVCCLAIKTIQNRLKQHELRIASASMKRSCDIDSELVDFGLDCNAFMGVYSGAETKLACSQQGSLITQSSAETLHKTMEYLLHILKKPPADVQKTQVTTSEALQSVVSEMGQENARPVVDASSKSPLPLEDRRSLQQLVEDLMRRSKYHHVSIRELFSVFAQ